MRARSGLLLSTRGYSARLWDLGALDRAQTEGHRGHAHALRFSPDGETLVSAGVGSAGASTDILAWETASGDQPPGFAVEPGGALESVALDIALSSDGRYLAAASKKVAFIWDVGRRALVRKVEGYTDLIEGVDFSPDGTSLATSGHDRTVRLWDLTGGEQPRCFGGTTTW